MQAAAFGSDPSRWPLPAATTPMQRWIRAVAAGGQGHYAVAHTELSALRRAQPYGPLASLASSTQGSLLRQLGWHTRARGWDGRALALAGGHPEARIDALVGLAADALGIGRFAVSATLLRRAEAELAGSDLSEFSGLWESSASWEASVTRLPIRLAWVSAELAMSTGDGATAVRHAERGVAMADSAGTSARHRVKSNVVLAAALCSSGCLDKARAIADLELEITGHLGLIPLRWALASLLDSIGSGSRTEREVQTIKDAAAQAVRRRGGIWSHR
ncbi:hypothetical protein H7J73_14975 [Mycolicibacterium komossense]|uniref:ATP-dependent transcriptional regulator n=1 Tax=Mycolicibacterium komossense TaxID=1779 RepID=A0ABT3CD49_9MYCO|nr:hypothetical protein [Mycolicibacterium komossense]MCV7227336.1 hypothetical protein [Mycolicibacterium komossense]